MNEQFRKLLSRATELADEEYGYDGSDYAEIVQEKFAELIVRECLDIAKNWEDQLENSSLLKESNAVGIVAYRIARQFGVKE